MARTKICCELGTAHHGDVDVALAMIDAAADAGCDAVKIQVYPHPNPRDPQSMWLDESMLSDSAITRLHVQAQRGNMEFWISAFDRGSFMRAEGHGPERLKIPSSESSSAWLRVEGPGDTQIPLVMSWPWGEKDAALHPKSAIHLTAIPLYPTPLECVKRATMLNGWSDHTVGLTTCYAAIVGCAPWIEAHLKLPGKTRERDWEKTPEDFRALRQFAEDVETMRTGVGEVFRNRWIA